MSVGSSSRSASGESSGWSVESGRRADAGRVVEAILRATARAGVEDYHPDRDWNWNDPIHRGLLRAKFEENAGVESGGDVGESVLPGFGPDRDGGNARDDCGESHPFVCDSCGHAVPFGRTCAMSVCGRCGAVWARDRAIQKAAKVRRLRKEKHQQTPDAEHQKLHHLVVSLPMSWLAALADAGVTLPEALEVAREAVKAVLEELRGQGVVIGHSFRGENDDGTLAEESDDRGEWKERQFGGREWEGDVREELAWMPHFHAIVVSDWIEGGELTERVEEETRWVVHRITGGESSTSLPSDGAMARALTYSISHADIEQHGDGPNRSAIWEVGSFDGSAFKSDARFTPRPWDLEWSGAVVREAARKTLGLSSSSTDCGAGLPGVDDPDEMARQILESLYPDDDRRRDVSTDVILAHVERGNIDVEVESSVGGGGGVVVRDAFGVRVGEGGWSGRVPDVPSSEVSGSVSFGGVVDDADGGCDDSGREVEECSGTLVPLGVVRSRGLLEDVEWCRNAAHVEEARAADRGWDDDLDPWRTSAPDGSRTIG